MITGLQTRFVGELGSCQRDRIKAIWRFVLALYIGHCFLDANGRSINVLIYYLLRVYLGATGQELVNVAERGYLAQEDALGPVWVDLLEHGLEVVREQLQDTAQ